MIDITKPHQTRDGRAVSNLHWNESVAMIEGYVSRFSMTSWFADGRHNKVRYDGLDLIPVPERRMKETAITADLAKKAMEHNRMIDEQNLLDSARAHVHEAVRICKEHGFMIEVRVNGPRNEDKLISMGRKYRTRNGGKADIRFTDGRGDMPVVGYVDGDNAVQTWDIFGKFRKTQESGLDLVLDEEGENL